MYVCGWRPSTHTSVRFTLSPGFAEYLLHLAPNTRGVCSACERTTKRAHRKNVRLCSSLLSELCIIESTPMIFDGQQGQNGYANGRDRLKKPRWRARAPPADLRTPAAARRLLIELLGWNFP